MKNINYTLIVMTLFSLFSCNEVERPNLGLNTQWLQFDNNNYLVSESATEPFRIPVLLAANENANGVDVQISIEASQAEGYTLEPSNGVVNIPAGEFVGYITVTPIDNTDTDGDITITMTLSEQNTFPVGIAGQGIYNTETLITIQDDDCPVALSSSYTGVSFASDNPGSLAPEFTAALSLVPGTTNTYTINSAWGPNFVGWATQDSSFNGQYIYSGILVVNDDLTVTITGDDTWATGGSGTYSSCNDEFNFVLTQDLFNGDFTVEVTLSGTGN